MNTTPKMMMMSKLETPPKMKKTPRGMKMAKKKTTPKIYITQKMKTTEQFNIYFILWPEDHRASHFKDHTAIKSLMFSTNITLWRVLFLSYTLPLGVH